MPTTLKKIFFNKSFSELLQSNSRNSLASESLSSSLSISTKDDIFTHEELEANSKATNFGRKKSFLDPERYASGLSLFDEVLADQLEEFL